MSANSSYVNLGPDDNSITEAPKFPVLWVVVALVVGGLAVWFLKGRGN